jgi:Na+/H+ antiporter NhaA
MGAEPADAASVVPAGLGGAAATVGIYLAFNAGSPSAHGWGTAMSTDTAFALGLFSVVGPRLPDRLRAFLLTILVADDLIGLLVIVVAYTGSVAVVPLIAAILFYGSQLRTGARFPHGQSTIRAVPLPRP